MLCMHHPLLLLLILQPFRNPQIVEKDEAKVMMARAVVVGMMVSPTPM